MDQLTIFIAASSIVVLALLIALVAWMRIWQKTVNHARTAAVFFSVCFLLYVGGQGLVILNVLDVLNTSPDISSYCYALGAILFAIGSIYQYKSVKK